MTRAAARWPANCTSVPRASSENGSPSSPSSTRKPKPAPSPTPTRAALPKPHMRIGLSWGSRPTHGRPAAIPARTTSGTSSAAAGAWRGSMPSQPATSRWPDVVTSRAAAGRGRQGAGLGQADGHRGVGSRGSRATRSRRPPGGGRGGDRRPGARAVHVLERARAVEATRRRAASADGSVGGAPDLEAPDGAVAAGQVGDHRAPSAGRHPPPRAGPGPAGRRADEPGRAAAGHRQGRAEGRSGPGARGAARRPAARRSRPAAGR